MGYRIQYPTFRKRKPKSKRLYVYTLCFFSLFLVLSHTLLAEEMDHLRKLLVPDETALMTLIDALTSGGSFADAVQTFCQDIFHGQ